MDDMETRVWQRVSGKTGVTLPDLLRMSREAAACLRQLPGGKLQCRLIGLAQQEEAVSRALAGIAHLQGEQSRPSPVGWKEENFQRGLALCYRRSRKIWEGLRSRAGDGEFGQIFSQLMVQEQQIGTTLLELVGLAER